MWFCFHTLCSNKSEVRWAKKWNVYNMQFAYHVSCNAHAIYINIQHEITFIIPVLRSVMHLWTGLMLLEKPLRTDFEGKKSALPMVLNWDRLQATYRAQGLFLTFQGASHTLNKADSKRGFGLFSKTPLISREKAAHQRQHPKISEKRNEAAAACLPKCRKSPSCLSALLFSESARSFADFPLCFEKRPLSLSLSCFSDHLCIMRCVCLYLPSRKTACDFEVFEEKRPLTLWGLCFYEFAFASRTIKPKEGTAPPFIP